MALNSNALLTVADLAAFMPEEAIPSSNDLATKAAEESINAVSAEIETMLGRPLEYAEDLVEDYPGHGTPFLVLRRAPVTEVTDIRIVDPLGNVVSTFDLSTLGFRIRAKAGVLEVAGGIPSSAPVAIRADYYTLPGLEYHNVRVTYSGGWLLPPQTDPGTWDQTPDNLPADLKHAARLGAQNEYLRRGHGRFLSSKSQADQTATFRDPEPGLLPKEARAIVKRYVRFGHPA